MRNVSLLVGIIALTTSVIGAFYDSKQFFQSYLFSYLFWSDLPLGALALAMIYPLTGGSWGALCHGTLEALSDTLFTIVFFSIPILLGMSSIYAWMDPQIASDPRVLHKHLYLNSISFVLRTFFYFGCWLSLNFLFKRHTEEPVKLQRLCAGGLVLLTFTVTFASVDWQMSVEPTWYSTIYGMVYIIGQALSAYAFTLIVLGISTKANKNKNFGKKSLLDLGNILLTLVMVWAYLSFMQYLIVWSGNLPHEVTWYNHRTQGGWQWIALILFLFQFSIPFIFLLFRRNKNKPSRLAWIGLMVFTVRILDHYWMLMPGLKPGTFLFPWQVMTTWLGIGGIWLSVFLNRLKKASHVFLLILLGIIESQLLDQRLLQAEPRLQSNPPAELEAYLARENQLLSSYGWVDQKKGIARIPIRRAMDFYTHTLPTETGPGTETTAPIPFSPPQPPSQQGSRSSDIRFEQHLGNKLPLETEFNDEYNRRQPLSAHFGTLPVIVVFTYFRCPNLCTLVLNGLTQALQGLPVSLGKDYQVLAITIDPSEKPPLALAKKRAYLAKLGFTESNELNESDKPNKPINSVFKSGELGTPSPWHFLTGNENQIRNLTDAAGFHYFRDPQSGEYAHPSGIVVITPKGEISQYFFGIQFDTKKLHQALLTARTGKKGNWIDEILLYCFHYDPKVSRNGPMIMTTIRATGALGAIIIFVFIITLFSTRKREQPL